MTLQSARELRDCIRATGIYCTVPLGQSRDGYFARIIASVEGPAKPIDFHSAGEWKAYQRDSVKRRLLSRPRSPLDIMIDRACGIES